MSYTYDSFASYEKLSEEAIRTLGKKPWEISCDAYDFIPENETSTTIGSIRTLFEKLEGELEDSMDYHIFYRGQSDKKYGLLPSIYREEALIQNEDKIFRDIIAQCPTDFKGSTSAFEKLVKMQHYSLPTRLLDITTNPLVAMYFACDDDEVDGKLFRFEVKTSDIKYFDSDAVSVVSNLFDIAMVFAVALMVALVSRYNMTEVFSQEDYTMVKNPGKENMEIITKEGNKINRYTPSEDQDKKEGKRGKKVGIAYELDNGEIIYVPE